MCEDIPSGISGSGYDIEEILTALSTLDEDIQYQIIRDLHCMESNRNNPSYDLTEKHAEGLNQPVVEDDIYKLIAAAEISMENAQTIDSNFPVGASVMDDEKVIYKGCNVPSEISGLGTCAERNALNTAAAEGASKLLAIAITSKMAKPIVPCGMCLQYIFEFSARQNHEIAIIMSDCNRNIKISSLPVLLPGAQSILKFKNIK